MLISMSKNRKARIIISMRRVRMVKIREKIFMRIIGLLGES